MALVFGDVDPHHQSRQLERFGEAGRMFVGLVQQKRAREEEKRQRELARAYQMIERYPEVVDAPEGQRLAEQFPEIAPYLDVVRNRGSVRKRIDSAGETWLSEADRLRSEHEQSLQRQALLASPTSPFGAPNLEAIAGLVQKSQVHPDSFLQRSAEALSPSERVAANLWAKDRGLKAPEPYYERRFDPMRDLPQGARAVLAAESGQLPPETGRAARIGADLEEGAGDQVRRDLDEARNRRAATSAEISRRGLDLRERGLELRARGGGGGRGSSASDFKAARKFAADTEKVYIDRAKLRQKAWDAEKKALEQNFEDSPENIKKLGPRPEVPPKIMPGEMNKMARQAAALATSAPEQEAILGAMVGQYNELVSDGVKPREAARRALQISEPPKPPDFSNVVSGGPSGAPPPQTAPPQQGAPPPAAPSREELVGATRGIVDQARGQGVEVNERDVELMIQDLLDGATPEQVLEQLLRGAG